MQKTTFFFQTFLIAGISLTASFSAYSETKRCNYQDYDPDTQECCNVLIGRNTYRMQPVPKGKCCGGYILTDSQECCDGKPLEKGKCAVFKGREYDSSKQGICNGKIYAFKELDSNPGYTEMCCNGRILPATVAGVEFECCYGMPTSKGMCSKKCAALKSTEGCCNGKSYNLTTQECCAGAIVDKGMCCAGMKMTPRQECCSGVIVSSGKCCGQEMLKNNEICFENAPLTKGTKLSCGSLLQYDPETQQCCNGKDVVGKDEKCPVVERVFDGTNLPKMGDVLNSGDPLVGAKLPGDEGNGTTQKRSLSNTTVVPGTTDANRPPLKNDAVLSSPVKQDTATVQPITDVSQTVIPPPPADMGAARREALNNSILRPVSPVLPETNTNPDLGDVVTPVQPAGNMNQVVIPPPPADTKSVNRNMQVSQPEITVKNKAEVTVEPKKTLSFTKLCAGKGYDSRTHECCRGVIVGQGKCIKSKRPTGAIKQVF